MDKYKLEDVFKKSGVPTVTFVEPDEFNKIFISLRTPGRGLIIEGPSGVGKTTCICHAINKLSGDSSIPIFSARNIEDIAYIKDLHKLMPFGTVIIDDFHRLDEDVKKYISDLLKVLADKEDRHNKLILIGINKAGNSLVSFSQDLNNRIDIIKIEKNSKDKILQLINLGEGALNIILNDKDSIAREANGSFHIAQIFCNELCIENLINETLETTQCVEYNIESIKSNILEEFGRVCEPIAKKFATGSKLRPEGRAPYLHLLKWLSTTNDRALDINDAIYLNPEHKPSITQVIEKGFLEKLLNQDIELNNYFHFEKNTKTLSIEDIKLFYFLKNLKWSSFIRKVGFSNISFKCTYDFALSFSGESRVIAEKIFNALELHSFNVFYDKNEEYKILAQDVEKYLSNIYSYDSEFVIVILDSQYPRKVFTKFESEKFKHRFGECRVIPIYTPSAQITAFDLTSGVGHLNIRDMNNDDEIYNCTNIIIQKYNSEIVPHRF